MAALDPCSPNYTFLNQGLSHAITHREAPAYAEPQKNTHFSLSSPKNLQQRGTEKGTPRSSHTRFSEALFQAKAVPESDESKLATQAAAASVSSPSLRDAQGSLPSYTVAS